MSSISSRGIFSTVSSRCFCIKRTTAAPCEVEPVAAAKRSHSNELESGTEGLSLRSALGLVLEFAVEEADVET